MNTVKNFILDCWQVLSKKDFWLLVFIVLFLSQLLTLTIPKEVVYRVVVPVESVE